jgi:hypothetical protein
MENTDDMDNTVLRIKDVVSCYCIQQKRVVESQMQMSSLRISMGTVLAAKAEQEERVARVEQVGQALQADVKEGEKLLREGRLRVEEINKCVYGSSSSSSTSSSRSSTSRSSTSRSSTSSSDRGGVGSRSLIGRGSMSDTGDAMGDASSDEGTSMGIVAKISRIGREVSLLLVKIANATDGDGGDGDGLFLIL